jgi:predicted Fe-Mo cluster-binding NifX family protein
MNVCIPVTQDLGLQSPVSRHFGSAPIFLAVDTESGTCRAIMNRDLHHEHGMCQPLLSLAGEKFDRMVVGGIGMGALNKLQAAGLRVFLSDCATVDEALAALKAGSLVEANAAMACAHHGEGHGGHGHHGHGGGPGPALA